MALITALRRLIKSQDVTNAYSWAASSWLTCVPSSKVSHLHFTLLCTVCRGVNLTSRSWLVPLFDCTALYWDVFNYIYHYHFYFVHPRWYKCGGQNNSKTSQGAWSWINTSQNSFDKSWTLERPYCRTALVSAIGLFNKPAAECIYSDEQNETDLSLPHRLKKNWLM